MADRQYSILVINWQDIRHPLAGGAEIHCHNLFSRLASRGHKIIQLSCGFKNAEASEEIDGITVIRRGNRNFFNYYVPTMVRELQNRYQFDIVIEDLNKIPFFTPLYISVPKLVLAHHLFGKAIYNAVGLLYGSYVWTAEQLIPKIYKNTPFSAVSDSTRAELNSMGLKTVDLLPNGNAYPTNDMLLKPKYPPLIGYFGRVEKYKRIDHLLAALPLVQKAVPNARLQIIGDGYHKTWLQNRVHRLGLDNSVEFTGRISEADKWKTLSQLSLGVCPSPKEGWGLSVMELAASGVPVIASDVPGLRESVCHNKTGRLYPFGDVSALAEQIIELLRSDDLRKQMSQAARSWASGRSWDKTADRAESIFESLLNPVEAFKLKPHLKVNIPKRE